jgi:hypothetical protein
MVALDERAHAIRDLQQAVVAAVEVAVVLRGELINDGGLVLAKALDLPGLLVVERSERLRGSKAGAVLGDGGDKRLERAKALAHRAELSRDGLEKLRLARDERFLART